MRVLATWRLKEEAWSKGATRCRRTGKAGAGKQQQNRIHQLCRS